MAVRHWSPRGLSLSVQLLPWPSLCGLWRCKSGFAVDDPGRQLCPFFSCFPLYQLSRQTAFITDVQRNPIWSQRRSVVVLDKEADRTPEEASRINPAFKGKVSAEEESSCWQLSFSRAWKAEAPCYRTDRSFTGQAALSEYPSQDHMD